MTVDYSIGALTKCSVNAAVYAAISIDFGKRGTILRRNGMRGTREHNAADARVGPYHVAGTIVIEPSPTQLSALMALAIGGNGAAQEMLTSFSVVVDRYEKVYTYAGCKVNRARITGRQGGIISCELDIIGKTETQSGSVNTPADTAPYIFSDLTLTLMSATRDAMSFELDIDNHIDPDRFLNYTTLPDVVELDRTIRLHTVHPYNDDNNDLYDQAITGGGGVLALNDGTTNHAFTFGCLQVPANSPAIRGKVEETLELVMEATRTGNTASVVFS